MAETSLTVTFVTDVITDDSGTPINASIQVALDSVRNNDRTQFLYGSKAYFKVYSAPSDMSLQLIASDGTITEEGSGTEDIDDVVTFGNSDNGSVTYPVQSIVASEWLGKSLGAVHGEGNRVVSVNSGVGILDVTYRTPFRRYAISVPTKDVDEYAVAIYIQGVVL